MPVSSTHSSLLRRIPGQLRQVFGLRKLRPGQHEAMSRVLRGLNTLAVMPTGAGKSLCYQLPATLLSGTTVVVSPLIALMQDQCDRLKALGIEAVQLHSGLSADAEQQSLFSLDSGRARVVFVTPERLVDAAFLERLRRRAISLLVVDEAHCISQWGHDFRPAFTQIGTMLPELGSPPVLALTATASDEVVADIARQLRIPAAGVLSGSSYRSNLAFSVETVSHEAAKLERVLDIVRNAGGPAIVYAATVRAAVGVHGALLSNGIGASLYHGKMRAPQRQASQLMFMSGATSVMVATNAFGLGIDKPDIRLVLHYQVPAGLDVYYQEAGRAGRDGAPARCVLLFLAGDRAVQQFFLNGRYPTLDDGNALITTLEGCQGNTRPWTLALLKEQLQRPISKLRVLVNLLSREGWVHVDDNGKILPSAAAAAAAAATADAAGRSRPELQALLNRYVDKSELDKERLEQMVAYAQTGGCRWRTLLDAFEEPLPFEGERCHTCDNCKRMAAHERQLESIAVPAERDAASAGASARKRFAEGDAVRVRRYGAGTVIEANAESITVRFDAVKEQRCFHPDFVKPQRARSPRSRADAPVG